MNNVFLVASNTSHLKHTARIFMLLSVMIIMGVLMYCNVSYNHNDDDVEFTIHVTPPLNSTNVMKEKVFLMFVIPTLPSHYMLRKAIRDTWAGHNWTNFTDVNDYYKTFKIMFIVGNLELKRQNYSKEFIEEYETHDDIRINEYLDEERLVIKYKVIWGMMRSIEEYNFEYLVKTDDDIFVNLPLLVRYMIRQSRNNTYTGNCGMGYGGWGNYPTWGYCSGGGYMLSKDVVVDMMEINKRTKVMIRPEDAYTGYLIYLLNTVKGRDIKLNSVHLPKGIQALAGGYKCGPVKQVLFRHRMGDYERMVELYKILNGELAELKC